MPATSYKMDRMNDLIKEYFGIGLQHREIVIFLRNVHNISISIRTLKRVISRLGLQGRKNYTNINDVVRFLRNELSTSIQLHGYRWLHLKCLQNGMIVTQKVIRELLTLMDPDGVEYRKRIRLRRRQYQSKGPNFLWHMDSYDKLKKYGICINGCIDGYSRHIIWLKASSTSNDPKVIAAYYLDSVKNLGGCPTTVRSDNGTENGVVQTIQTILCDLYKTENRSKPAFIRGRSTAKQRIESWWSILPKQDVQYWINLFESMRDNNVISGSYLDKSLIQFCFMNIIQNELNKVAFEWNTHKIRGSRNSISPTGRPMCLFEIPHLYGAEDCLVAIPNGVADIIKADVNVVKEIPYCDEDVENVCNCIVSENGYVRDYDPYNAVNLYIKLRTEIYHLLENINP